VQSLLVTTQHSQVVQTKSSTRSLRLCSPCFSPLGGLSRFLTETPSMCPHGRGLAERSSLLVLYTSPPQGSQAPARLPLPVAASLLNAHCDQASRQESLPEVTPLSSETGRGTVSSDHCRAPSWGDREGTWWERSPAS